MYNASGKEKRGEKRLVFRTSREPTLGLTSKEPTHLRALGSETAAAQQRTESKRPFEIYIQATIIIWNLYLNLNHDFMSPPCTL